MAYDIVYDVNTYLEKKSKSMKLSFIIPAYNASPFLGRCLDSILTQDYNGGEIEVIIINDGSKDNTKDIAYQYVKKYPFVSLYSQTNQGLSMARNKGLDYVKGEYIWFVDSDDTIIKGAIGLILSSLSINQPDVLCLRAGDIRGERIIPRFVFKHDKETTGKEALKQWRSPCAPFFIFNRNLIESNHLRFAEGLYHEDSEFTPRALYLAKKVSYLNELAYLVFANPSSITRSNNTKRAFDTLIVCRRLESFMEEKVEGSDKPLFSTIIAISINSSLHDVIHNMDEDAQKLLDKALYNERSLLKHYWNSRNFKYRIEYLILRLNSKRTTKAYKLFTKYS